MNFHFFRCFTGTVYATKLLLILFVLLSNYDVKMYFVVLDILNIFILSAMFCRDTILYGCS